MVPECSEKLKHELEAAQKLADFGIGLRLQSDGTFMVEHLTPNSAAQQGGLREGDVIVAVGAGGTDGGKKELTPLDGQKMTKEAAEKLFQGPEGNSITVVSIQDGKRVESSYTLRVPEPDFADAKVIDKNIGYLKLPTFMSTELFAKLMDKGLNLDVETPGGLQGLVLDLRYDGGGLVDLSKDLIGLLLRQGIAVHEKKRTKWGFEDVTTTITPTHLDSTKLSPPMREVFKDIQTLPLVILVNGSTASASEIVTGALRDSREDTTVVGKRSFGKGVEMSVITLPNCATLAVTSAQYTTPSGQWLHNVGIKPDVEVNQPRDSNEDLQLEKAVQILHQKAESNPVNVVQMTDQESKPLLGPVPERVESPAKVDWSQVAKENRVKLVVTALGVLCAALLVAFLLIARKQKED